MVRAISAFLEFCYLVRQDTIDDDALKAIDTVLERYHQERVIFEETGVRPNGISLPRQHALKHYPRLIRLFASPNGLCSSMMEARHITAVKKPYRRSSRNEALGQIILINQRLDKLAALRVHLAASKMLQGPCPRLPLSMLQEHDDVLATALDEPSDNEDGPDGPSDAGPAQPGAEDGGDDVLGAGDEAEDGAVGGLREPALMAECVLSKTTCESLRK